MSVERDFNSLLGISIRLCSSILPENYKFTELGFQNRFKRSRTIKLENDTLSYNILSNFMAESFISKKFLEV